MSLLTRLRHAAATIGALARRRRLKAEIDEEIAFHLEQEAARHRSRGLPPVAARLEAERRFGPAVARREQMQEAWGLAWIDGLVQDVRHAVTGLRRAPGFFALVVLSLGLGIGLTSALFSVVDAVLLRPLPLPAAERLVFVEEWRGAEVGGGTPLRLLDWQRSEAIDSAAGFYGEGQVLTGESPRRIDVLRTVGPFLRTLSVVPVVGRSPTPDEEAGRGAAVALLSHAFWTEAFGADPSIVGRVLACSGQRFEIIGVLPANAQGLTDADAWAPASADVQAAPRSAGFLAQVARLREGSALARAQAAFDVRATALERAHPQTDRGVRARLVPLHQYVSREARTPLLTLWAAMGAVLLVAGVNVGGLLVARGLHRRQEAAVRLTLGAGPSRLVRLFLAEAAILGLACAAAGVGAASLLLDVLKIVLPADTPRLATAVLDGRTVAFAVALALASAIVAALLPAWHAARYASAGDLKDGGRTTAGRSRARLQSGLVVAEIAVSLVLLVTGASFASGVSRMSRVPLGFAPQHAIGFSLPLGWDTPPERIASVSAGVLEAVGAVPGVTAAGLVDRLPLGGGSETAGALVRGQVGSPGQEAIVVGWRTASAGFFRAAGVPLLAGDLYRDRPDAREAVVNQRFVTAFLGGRPPIGAEVAFKGRGAVADGDRVWFRVVGVAADLRQEPASDPRPQVFMPWGARYWPLLHVVVRTAGEADGLAPALRRAVAAVDPDLVVEDLQAMPEFVDATRRPARVQVALMSAFAAAALLLTAIGLFALLAADVARRTREFGIRVALGAAPADVARAAARRGLALLATGVVVGLAGALAAGRLLAAVVDGVDPLDPSAYAAGVIVLALTALVATAIPARRAAAVDPITALRAE